jgi:VanZ family protein
MNGLISSGLKSPRVFVVSLVDCVLYAASDEILQLFVHGRAEEFKDKLIDSMGATLGIIMYGLLSKISSFTIIRYRNLDD